jgi:hypothetical protein
MANRYFLNIGANWGDTANWSDTSGGTGGFSVPTNADDVFFDANSGNCTVNASARTAKTLNFTGYTNTITMTFGITVSGSVTLVAAMTIAGASGLTINATGTFTSNGKTWPNALTFSATNTLTLADNLTLNGLLAITGVTTVNGTFNINASGGISLLVNLLQGTGNTTLNLLGGTWSGIGALALNTNINGNVTISGTVAYSTGTLTYVAGTVTTTGSTLNIPGASSATLDTDRGATKITFNIIQQTGSGSTLTLLSDLNLNGQITISGLGLTVNGTFNINSFGLGGIGSLGQGTGTTTLNLLGGTWSGFGTVSLNTNLNGNLNINLSGAGGFSTRTLTYVSGSISCSGGITFTSCTLNVAQIQFPNTAFANVTLLADLNISGQVSSSAISASGAFNVNIGGGLRVTSNQLGGTATFVIRGGTIDFTGAANGALNANVVLNGNVYILNYNQLGGTLTYLGGTVTGDLLGISSGGSGNPTLINMDKVQLRRVSITANQNLQINKFFNGTASNPTRIQCATAGATYVVTFQDTLEKIANNVKVSGCNISRPGQLLINGANSNKGTNTGIRYINQSPNGLPKNSPPIPPQMTFGIGNISDPTRVIS